MSKTIRLIMVVLALVASSFVLTPMAGACNPATSGSMPCG